MKTIQKIRVMIVDDHDMLREGLAAFLKAFRDLELVGEASNGLEAVREYQNIHPDIILMDLKMPEMDGVTAIQIIHGSNPEIGIIALTSFEDEKIVKSAMQAGAKSYLLKNIPANRLAEAIRTTYSGLPTLAPEVTQMLLSSPPPKDLKSASLISLTKREKEILNLLVKGYSNDKIASELSISRNTVKNHVSNILSKLDVKTRTEALLLMMGENSS